MYYIYKKLKLNYKKLKFFFSFLFFSAIAISYDLINRCLFFFPQCTGWKIESLTIKSIIQISSKLSYVHIDIKWLVIDMYIYLNLKTTQSCYILQI